MKQDKVNVKVVPDTRRSKTGERFPLKLRITYKGIRKYYATGFDATPEEWEQLNSTEAKGNLRRIRQELGIIEKDAARCCEGIVPFSFSQFESSFFEERIYTESVETLYNNYISELQSKDQHGTADSYTTSINCLKKYRRSPQLGHITKEYLEGFESWMISRGRSITTVGIYLRPLRTIMNIARENGLIKPETYPFGKRKYIIPTGKNIKKALTKAQLKQIFEYPTDPGSGMEKAKDFWIFSYLCNGINVMDIALLKHKNAHPSYITFLREKTKRTTKGSPVNIVATRNTYIDGIIAKWGQAYTHPEGYIFNIAEIGDDSVTIRKKVKQFTKNTNKWMKKMGEELGFEMPVTTYVARHSYATILVQSGAPLKLASTNLGHQSLMTTERYFAGFEMGVQAEYARKLVEF
ncbi:site-specific integrase [Chitinophaga sp. Cy-1792]|uniref:tyrosine-type recombinase/integrase n=1 Tax=Chitinophaga sp. Cy-1792 TaxID=2608339 RepID=UPI00141DFA98|nr:site-specific integrase [Chitinophaga sp. Cy-1792]NIG52514.1 tyrosine-type recombinase/integrase [Chitinophaga sp. Cy-1792]